MTLGGYERVWFYYAYLTELAAISDATARGIPVPPRVICPHCVGNTWDTADTFDKFMAGVSFTPIFKFQVIKKDTLGTGVSDLIGNAKQISPTASYNSCEVVNSNALTELR